jgi:hypothetical protein
MTTPTDDKVAHIDAWIEDVVTLAHRFDQDLSRRVNREDGIIHHPALAERLTAFIEREQLRHDRAGPMFVSLLGGENDDHMTVHALLDEPHNLAEQLRLLHAHFSAPKRDYSHEVNRKVTDRLMIWLRTALLEREQGVSIEALTAALDRYFDPNRSHQMAFIQLPVFEGIPEALEALAQQRLAALPKDERDYDDALSVDQTLYGETFMSMAALIRDSLNGEVLTVDKLAHWKIPLPNTPIQTRSLETYIQLIEAMPDSNPFANAMAISQYSADEIVAHLDQVKGLIDSVHYDISQQKRLVSSIMAVTSPYTDQGQRIFNTLIPPDETLATVFRHQLKAFMTPEYLFEVIQAHRNNPNSYLEGFTNDPMLDKTYQPKLIDLYSKAGDASQSIRLIMQEFVSRRTDGDSDPLAPNKVLIRLTARLLNETQIDRSLCERILPYINPEWSSAGVRNPIPFLIDALEASKPLLKKSMIDDLMVVEEGRMLLDDIETLNNAALRIAEHVTLKVEEKPLLSINNRVERMVAGVVKRFEQDVGHFDPKKEIDDKTFDHML